MKTDIWSIWNLTHVSVDTFFPFHSFSYFSEGIFFIERLGINNAFLARITEDIEVGFFFNEEETLEGITEINDDGGGDGGRWCYEVT